MNSLDNDMHIAESHGDTLDYVDDDKQRRKEDNMNHNNNGYTFLQRCAVMMARWPKTCFWVVSIVSLAISGLGLYYGDFSVTFEKKGWMSRGTLISNRHQQTLLVRKHQEQLSAVDNEEIWRDLTTNVQPSWENNGRRRLSSSSSLLQHLDASPLSFMEDLETSHNWASPLLSSSSSNQDFRQLVVDERGNELGLLTLMDRCDVNFYTNADFYGRRRLWPKWKVKKEGASALDPDVLHELCLAEEQTQKVLEDRGLCFGCKDGGCLPPYSVVLYARLEVPNGFQLSCRELADAWAPYQEETEEEWKKCVKHMRTRESEEDRGPCKATFTGT